jgi:hydroxyacylglutathione hydrolase
MLLKQSYLGCLLHALYLIADEATGTAVVVNPQRDIDQYVQDAAQQGLQIRSVFLTHFHTDFLAGHLELPDRVGATLFIQLITADQPDAPAYFAYDTMLNRRQRLTLKAAPVHELIRRSSVCSAP